MGQNSRKKVSKAVPEPVIVTQSTPWFQLGIIGLAIVVFAGFVMAEGMYVQHITDQELASHTSANTTNSLKRRQSITTAAATAPTLSADSPATPALPLPSSVSGSVSSATISQTIISSDVSNMATPGQATTLPLQTVTQLVGQAGPSILQAGQGTNGLDIN